MATGATGQLGLALPVQGELSGTWGDTVNNGITQYTNIAIAGTLTLTGDGAVTLSNTTGDASASNIVSTLTGAGTVTAQFAIIRVTGTLTTAKVVTAPSYSKTYLVVNAATGSTVSFIRSGQTPAISIAVGESALVYFNGTDYVKVAGTTSGAAAGSNTQVQFNSSGVLAGSANLTFDGTNLTVGGSATATRFIPSGSTVATNGMYLPAADTLGFSTASTERMRIGSTGGVGIGATSLTQFGLRVSKAITGNVSSYGVRTDGVIQSDVTSAAYIFNAVGSTAAASFTLGQLLYFYATQSTIGAGSSVTSQFGYYVDSNLIGATNNYGFYGGIASGTGRYNLYMAGTADNYFEGPIGQSGTPSAGTNVLIAKNLTGSVTAQAIRVTSQIQADVTSEARAFISLLSTAASAPVGNVQHFFAGQGSIGAGSTITNQFGFAAQSSLTGATTNYGFYGAIASGTGRYNLYMAGTADNYLGGNLGIGGNSSSDILYVSKNITGSTSSSGIAIVGAVQSGVTSTANYLTTYVSTAAASFTLSTLYHYRTQQGTFGAGSTVTNQHGFFAESTLIGATNNYGFYGNIASGSNRWNFYAGGTAANYFAGNVGIATTSPGSALDVKGTLRLSGSSSGYVGLAPAAAAGSTTYTLPSADGSSGQFLSTNGSGTLSWATGGGGGGSAATPTALGTVYGITPSGTAAVALGYEAANTTTGALGVVAVGYQALKANTANYNTAVGYASGLNNTSGKITAFGASALVANTTGQNNYAFGGTDGTTIGSALQANTTGANNSAFAGGALLSNTTGGNNSAFGMSALYSNTTASNNTAVGFESGKANTTGDYLSALGYQAALSNTTGRFNIAIGALSLGLNTTGSNNVAVGLEALYANTTANNNVAAGYQALKANTTGTQNVAIGSGALQTNTTSSRNTAVGLNALNLSTAADNTAVGFTALAATTTGASNVAVGSYALVANTNGSFNTAIGMNALPANTSASNNTAVGNQTLYLTTTGAENTAVGQNALYNTSTGSQNTAVGRRALEGNTTATANTAVGYTALVTNTTGASNVAIGHGALQANTTASSNTAVGYQAGYSITTGSDNTAVGYQAGDAITTGSYNVAIGRLSMDNSAGITGNQNTAVGNGSMRALTSGEYNTAVGTNALNANTTASNNTAVGREALLNHTTGTSNIAVGYQALYTSTTSQYNTAMGVEALRAVTSASSNVALGGYAGLNITTGNENLMLGYDSGVTGSPSGQITTQANRICMGSGRMTNAYIQIAWTVTSDSRDKTDIIDAKYGLNFVNELRPVEYKWDKRIRYENNTPDGTHKETKSQLGFLAQDVIALEKKYGAVAKDLLIADDETDELYRITETKMIPVLVKALQELSAQVETLKSEIATLKGA